jgi:hypothetical protein
MIKNLSGQAVRAMRHASRAYNNALSADERHIVGMGGCQLDHGEIKNVGIGVFWDCAMIASPPIAAVAGDIDAIRLNGYDGMPLVFEI